MPGGRSLDVLFLTKYPKEGASSRYRVYQYVELLRQNHINADVRSLYSPAGYQAVFHGGGAVKRLFYTLIGSLARVRDVLLSGRYDLVYMQRELLPAGAPVLERWLARRRVPVVFDYDDALFIHKPSAVSASASRLRSPDRITEIFGLVDAVVAGNAFLARQARQYGATAHVLEVAEDTGCLRARPPHRNDEPLIVGWLGSKSTEKYLELLTPVFQRFFAAYPGARLRVVGGGRYRPEGVPVDHVTWSLETEVSNLHSFDIGIMPLPLEPWSEGKCGGKARTYMAAGVPSVVQDIGYNRELIKDGYTGFLAKSHDDWLGHLQRLASDAGLRQSIANAARADVEKRFGRALIARQMAEIIRAVAGGPH